MKTQILCLAEGKICQFKLIKKKSKKKKKQMNHFIIEEFLQANYMTRLKIYII